MTRDSDAQSNRKNKLKEKKLEVQMGPSGRLSAERRQLVKQAAKQTAPRQREGRRRDPAAAADQPQGSAGSRLLSILREQLPGPGSSKTAN